MSDDSLLPHLLDIISDPASEGLILAGGYGLRLKQQSIIERGERTLIAEVPAARATQDLDFFLRLELFVQKERGLAVRDLLHRLSYTEHTPDWQFGKPGGNPGDGPVKVDLLARLPLEGEPVRVKAHRVGSRAGVGLHGYRTPEAFAVEDAPISLRVAGQGSNGLLVQADVLVPNPYAWLTMKVEAASDWWQQESGNRPPRPFREKHVLDVYILVALLLEAELTEASELAARYFDHSMAEQVRNAVVTLYGAADAPGFLEAQRQAGIRLDHGLFWTGLQSVLQLP